MKILLYGAGGHAKVVLDVIRSQDVGRVVGLIDDQPEKAETEFHGYRILGDASFLEKADRQIADMAIVAIGDNRIRLQKAAFLKSLGYELGIAIHPKTILAEDVKIGEGTVVMPGVIVNTGTVVGANAILNTGALIDHDCSIGEGAHISPGVALAGNVTVGRLAHIGIGATAIPGRKIGEGALVGAGSAVIRDVPAGETVVGIPAKPMRGRYS